MIQQSNDWSKYKFYIPEGDQKWHHQEKVSSRVQYYCFRHKQPHSSAFINNCLQHFHKEKEQAWFTSNSVGLPPLVTTSCVGNGYVGNFCFKKIRKSLTIKTKVVRE